MAQELEVEQGDGEFVLVLADAGVDIHEGKGLFLIKQLQEGPFLVGESGSF